MARRRAVSNRVKRVAREIGELVTDLFAESTPTDEDLDEDEDDLDDDLDEDEDEVLTCVLQYGLDTVPVEIEAPAQTIRQAFAANAEELNLNPERAATYKVNGQLISGDDVVLANELYVANVTGEKKG